MGLKKLWNLSSEISRQIKTINQNSAGQGPKQPNSTLKLALTPKPACVQQRVRLETSRGLFHLNYHCEIHIASHSCDAVIKVERRKHG